MVIRHFPSAFLLLVIHCAYSWGDVIFRTDVDSLQSGIQSNAEFAVGASFDVHLYLTINGTNTVSTFSTSIQFDKDVLVLESVSIPTRPTGFEQASPVADLTQANANGLFERFDALNLDSQNDLGSNFDQIIGTLRFRAISAGSDIQIAPLFASNGIDGILDSNLDSIPLGTTLGDGGVFFQGGTLTFNNSSSVPEPASLLLTSGALAGWFAHSRVRRRKQRPELSQ